MLQILEEKLILTHYNCFQSVVSALTTPQNPLINELGPLMGGGKAPMGMCGALYGAMEQNPDKKAEILKNFIDETGDFTCSHLRGGAKSCSELVDLAVKLAK
ncbi:Conserved_hypothetical protein [Hexamita inflata]|uniref:C_GCAxxG_C_C family protein n=1 Tax=Hexamita inflata TaxID=28002 RepID=A0AA86P6Z3_9EUKA|nr:Conserved hypothetical protein [Hexamita inflata]